MKKQMTLSMVFMLLWVSLSFAEEVPVSLNLYDDIQLPGSSSSSIKGVRFNVLYGVNENLTGVDWGLFLPINVLRGDLVGAQFGIYNQVDGSVTGFQSAVVNNSGSVTGVQMGFVNIAQNLKGLQIGLLNFHKSGSGISAPPFFPIVNWSF